MDLLGDKPEFRIDDETSRVFSRHENEPPQYVSGDAVVKNSSITEGCEIYGTVINSVLGYGVKVEKGATVKDSVIMQGSVVKSGAKVLYSILDEDVTVSKNSVVGADKEKTKEVTVLGAGTVLPEGMIVEEGKILSSDDVKGGKA